MYILYTDGSCLGNPGPGGYACIITHPQKMEVIVQGGEAHTTNNRMELTAPIKGLQAIPEGSTAHVVTDSNYLVKGMSEWIYGWKRKNWKNSKNKPVENQDLWERLDSLSQARKVTWEWVEAHAGHPENERCDEIAKEEASKFFK